MNFDMVSVNETEKRLITVKQQIEKLKVWNKVQESRLMQKLQINQNSDNEECVAVNPRSKHNFDGLNDICSVELTNNQREFDILDEQPLIPLHEDFQSLLDAKLNEEKSNCYSTNERRIIHEKKPFLRKGEGLSRFRMKAEDFKLKKKKRTLKKNPSKSNNALVIKSKKMQVNKCSSTSPQTKKNATLEAFEILEQKINDSSFCSTSSMITQLMEDSVKSTPLKPTEDVFHRRQIEDLERERNKHHMCSEYDFFGVGKLDVIDEEPSKLKDTSSEEPNVTTENPNSDQYNLVIVDLQNKNKYLSNFDEEQFDSSECSSKCSCCQDDSHYMSKSLSVLTEQTTTIYSPIKNQSVHEIHCLSTDGIYADSRIEHAQLSREEELNETQNNDDGLLKSLLHLRLRELETEIDAFRSENSHLKNLRGDYEIEYNKFCAEKVQFLAKIRAEHLKGTNELEQEKKKLQREKIAFEKYIKDIKNKPNKEEKEEIRLLKEELKKMRDEISKKDSRWAAAQARIRTEMKQLKDHNTALKEELEKLKNSGKKVTFSSTKKCKSRINSSKVSSQEILKSKTSDYCNSAINNPLQNFEFNDTQYVNGIRSLAETIESSISPVISNEMCKSVCVSSYLNEEKFDEIQKIDGTINSRHNVNDESDVTESVDSNGNVEKLYQDGRKEIWYTNGNVKKISADGKMIKTIYYNGDVKELLTENQTVKYYYAGTKVWHTQYNDGFEIMEFPNGRIEKRLKDGSAEITYPNGTMYNESFSGEEKWTHTDGTVLINNKEKNEKKILFPNGQREVHTTEYKKREYPDGTVKIVYINGNEETRYANGRIRLKSKDGCLLSDSLVEFNKS